jgi:ABC-2 type transport system permease protein
VSGARIVRLIGRDLRLGPRSPIMLWALAMPLVITILLHVALVALFERTLRLGITEPGGSALAQAAAGLAGIEVRRVGSADELRKLVASRDVDAGIVLGEGFVQELRAGDRPRLRFLVGGQTPPADRFLLALATLDLLRSPSGRGAPVAVVLHTAGSSRQPSLRERLLPAIVLFVLIIAGIFVPAFLLVGEREQRTLHALLVTPVTLAEVLLAKAGLGLLLAFVMCGLTLVINGVTHGQPLALFMSLLVAALLCVEIGLIYATLAEDARSLYTLIKTLNVLLAIPVFFYLFPSWPRWIAKLFPTYWIIEPVQRISLHGASLSAVAGELGVALAICGALLVPLAILTRRLAGRLAAG